MNKEEFCVIEFPYGTAKINLFSVHLSTYEDERILACKELNRIISKIDKNEIIIVGGDFNVGVTRLGKGKYTFEKRDEYEEYNILGKKLKQLPNILYSGEQPYTEGNDYIKYYIRQYYNLPEDFVINYEE